MAGDGEKNTSQDKWRGSDGSNGTRGWERGKTASSRLQDKNPGKPGVASATSLRPSSAPAWGPAKQQTGSGMQILKTTGSGTPSRASTQAVTTPSTGGGTSSWAALIGGHGGASSSGKTTPKTATSPQAKPVVHQSPEDTTDSSPVCPRSFSFRRGNGVILVHEAPISLKSPQSPAKNKISAAEQQNGGGPISASTTVTASPRLSWAEKAKLAAAQAIASPPPRKTPAAVASSPKGKQNTKAAAQVTSPKHGQGAPRSPGGVDSRQEYNNRGSQSRSSHGEGLDHHHHHQHEKSKAINHQVHRDSHYIKESVVEIGAPQLLSVVLEPEPPVAMQNEKEDEEENGNDAVVAAEQEKTTSSPPSDIKEALDTLCSSSTSWKLPNNNNKTSSSLQQQRVQPRGIKNPGNLCFVNAVLQGLMGTSSFCHILLALRSLAQSGDEILDAKAYPVLSAMVNVAAEFSQKLPENVTVVDKKASNTTNDSPKAKNANLVTVLGGHPVSSALIMDIINQFAPRQQVQQQQVQPSLQRKGSSSNGGGEGQVEQEDAHEFLHFLLDKMDSELLALRKAVKKSTEEESPAPPAHHVGGGELDRFEDDDGWLVKSGKKAVRQQEVSAVGHSNEAASIITALFQGKFATSVACAGAPNSVTVHPFMIVELPIYSDTIRSISDCFDALTAAEVLEDYKPAAGAIPQQAAKTERFLHLPVVLVLHLMRFQYTGKSAKISKYVSFEPQLAMRSSWMATGTPDRGAIYNLVATVTHHGKTISRGHYTSDVVQPDGKWLRFDDSNVYWVKEQQVLSDTPYLLVYERQR